MNQERWKDAVAEGKAALEVLEPLVQREPLTTEIRYQLTDVHLARGRALAGMNRVQDAREAWERALAAIEPLAHESDLIQAQIRRANVLLRLDRIDEAEPVVRSVSGTQGWSSELEDLATEKGIDDSSE